ncbi:phage tail protein [Tabrizicola aquatica]|uniref:phage tail protein n=1 Tax=Tabrizicola aquatica TaxID=909926 RepID=UPI000CD2EBD7|nr:tail fiber protein [Tabrizicola aquatica]
MDPILGTIIMFAGNFAPKGWAFCNGQLMSISQNSALFSLLGVAYGGDGITTFGLPDLQGRVPMHPGNGSGLTPRVLGEKVGTETVTLQASQVPPHSHDLLVANVAGDNDRPQGDMLARSQIYTDKTDATVTLNALSCAPAGGGQPHDNIQPSLCVNYIICTEGIYPSRP